MVVHPRVVMCGESNDIGDDFEQRVQNRSGYCRRLSGDAIRLCIVPPVAGSSRERYAAHGLLRDASAAASASGCVPCSVCQHCIFDIIACGPLSFSLYLSLFPTLTHSLPTRNIHVEFAVQRDVARQPQHASAEQHYNFARGSRFISDSRHDRDECSH